MPKFRLYSSLTGAKMIIDRDGKEETIDIERPFWKDVLIAKWVSDKYSIHRRGILIRKANIIGKTGLLGRVREEVRLFTKLVVYSKDKKEFEIIERDYFWHKEFIVKHNGKTIGSFRHVGVYIPLISSMGKGFEGEWEDIPKDKETLLVLSLISVCT